MAAALSPDMLATDLAYYLARKGVKTPFCVQAPFCVQEYSVNFALANRVDYYLFLSHIHLY